MKIVELSNVEKITKISASNPANKSQDCFRIVLRKISAKGSVLMQAEKFCKKQVFHQNIPLDQVANWAEANLCGFFKQICVLTDGLEVTYLTSAKGVTKRLQKSVAPRDEKPLANNRAKNYLINEGDDIPVFVDLGIFTKEGKIVNSMFDKFKQINRFVEILDDCFKHYDGKNLTLLDFGCGKSYLTFVIYHYFVKIKNIDVKIVGYDLKTDVVKYCNALATKYGCKNLTFVVADVTKDKLLDEKIDAVVSLHACDVATDYALHYAISKGAKYLFSVPCCQHEVNATIHSGGDMDVLLKYGIVKERVSALLTDSIRAMILEDCGYSVDVMEFVDLAHSPKNLMIRATKTRNSNNKNKQKIEQLIANYGFSQKLYDLIYK